MSTYAVRFTAGNGEKIARLLDFVRSLDFVDAVEPIFGNQPVIEDAPLVTSTEMVDQTLSLEQMKIKYPNQWVLIADPQRKDTKVIGGRVVLAAPDKRTLALHAKPIIAKYPGATHFFTGDKPKIGHIGLAKKISV